MTVDDIIEEALIDSYGDEEQIASFCSYSQDELRFPIPALILGHPVVITGIDNDDSRVLAKVKDGTAKATIDLRDLVVSNDTKDTRPIQAYKKWQGGW